MRLARVSGGEGPPSGALRRAALQHVAPLTGLRGDVDAWDASPPERQGDGLIGHGVRGVVTDGDASRRGFSDPARTRHG